MIESLENIYKYTKCFENDDTTFEKHKPNFSIEQFDDHFIINASNPILNNDVEDVKRRIDFIKKLDTAELKELYIDTIKNGRFTSQGGAGLGFIKIARTTDNNIDYKFEKLDDEYSYFTLIIEVPKIPA